LNLDVAAKLQQRQQNQQRQQLPKPQVAIIGAGWAGCAAAVELTLRGHAVHIFEAARQPGGRARALHRDRDDWQAGLDNGQHILLGAYTESLRLMRVVGVDPRTALLRLPLQMRYPPGGGGMDFHCPRLPAPLHLLAGLARTRGLAWDDKLALARFSTAAHWIDWRLNLDCSVAELLERFDQTPRNIALLWRPLCLAALNTPPERASAQVFLHVLRDSLGAPRSASDMLLPRTDLGRLFPVPALHFIAQHGGHVRLGCRVSAVNLQDGLFCIAHAAQASPLFDRVILAVPAQESARLLAGCLDEDMPEPGVMAAESRDHLQAAQPAPMEPATSPVARPRPLRHEPITTCYLRYDPGVALALPLYALRDDPATGQWGQFVFDRGQLDAAQRGVLAVVISASTDALAMPAETLAGMIAGQLATVFADERLRRPLAVQVVSDKRATFSCTPGLVRPTATTAITGLFLAGDHVAGDYPSTIEGAVRSGVHAARLAVPR
jgi:squalene-associated FAD-dependent desaturase